MNQYIAGDLVTVTANFTNTSGTPTDPTLVSLKVGRKFTGNSTSTYNNGSLAGPYAIVKASTGDYTANIDTTGFNQAQYTYEWIGTGACQVVQYGVFAVTSSPLP